MRRHLTSAVLATALVLSVAACAGGSATTAAAPSTAVSSPSPTVPAKITTASFVTSTTDALTKAGSYAFSYTMTASGTTLGGSGRVVMSSPTDLTMATTTDTGSGKVSMVMVGGHLYMDGAIAGAAGKWIALTDATTPSLAGLADQLKESADPSAMLSKLSGDAITVVRGEKSTVDGVEVTAYTMTMDVAELAKATGQDVTTAELDQLKAAGTDGKMGLVYYVDKDNLPIKVSLTMGDVMTEEMSYSGFGAQEPVAAPAAETVILASALGI